MCREIGRQLGQKLRQVRVRMSTELRYHIDRSHRPHIENTTLRELMHRATWNEGALGELKAMAARMQMRAMYNRELEADEKAIIEASKYANLFWSRGNAEDSPK